MDRITANQMWRDIKRNSKEIEELYKELNEALNDTKSLNVSGAKAFSSIQEIIDRKTERIKSCINLFLE